MGWGQSGRWNFGWGWCGPASKVFSHRSMHMTRTFEKDLWQGHFFIAPSRHGTSHSVPPGEVNYRANIWALRWISCETWYWFGNVREFRELGVTHVLATTACGSLREAITPGLFLLPSSFIGQDTEGRSTCSRAKLSQTGPLGGHSLSIPAMGFQGCVTYPWSQVRHKSSVILSRLWTCGALMNHLIQPSVQPWGL